MHLTAWITLAALAVYGWTFFAAGRARVAYKVEAPSMDGPPEFLRAMRVQANTLEQLPLLLAPLWLCAWFLGDAWATAGGAVWCVGRIMYALAYAKFPPSRAAGFVIALIGSGGLMAGTAAGLLLR